MGAAQAVQDAQHEKVTQTLGQHKEEMAGHQTTLDGHLEQLDTHRGELNTHSHQLGLAKAAMDQDLCGGYGTNRLKGTSRDILVNWDSQPRKTHSQEIADELERSTNGSDDNVPKAAPARRRLAAD